MSYDAWAAGIAQTAPWLTEAQRQWLWGQHQQYGIVSLADVPDFTQEQYEAFERAEAGAAIARAQSAQSHAEFGKLVGTIGTTFGTWTSPFWARIKKDEEANLRRAREEQARIERELAAKEAAWKKATSRSGTLRAGATSSRWTRAMAAMARARAGIGAGSLTPRSTFTARSIRQAHLLPPLLLALLQR